jgi:FtsP/CotA-like multicopper oxidase with cupredoxin domain
MAFSVQGQSNPPFANPKNIEYGGGIVELTAAPARVVWSGVPIHTNVYSAKYNGKEYIPSYTPPTIRINPDQNNALNIKLFNHIGALNLKCAEEHHEAFTNLHYHGFEVSPVEPGDDVVNIKIKRGQFYDYQVLFPEVPGKKHPEGMFWYHPHPHGCSHAQVNEGLSGVLIVGDLLKAKYPHLAGIQEQILLLKDGSPTPKGAKKEEANMQALAANPAAVLPTPRITVNGLNTPRMIIKPNEFQFFRIGNVGSNDYVKLALPNIKAWIIAADGMATRQPIPLDSRPGQGWILPPGSRVEIIVRGPLSGSYKLVTRPVLAARTPREEETLALLEVSKTSEKEPQSDIHAQLAELQNAPSMPSVYYPGKEEFSSVNTSLPCQYNTPSPDPRYTFVFTQKTGDKGSRFLMNGKEYDENRLDVSCPIPSTPTWTIFNDTEQHHTFHIHQIHFRVDKIMDKNGERPITEEEAPIRDNVDLPPRTGVQITLPFDETYLAGKFVMHCHILFHEDRGMMMNIELHLLNRTHLING